MKLHDVAEPHLVQITLDVLAAGTLRELRPPHQ